MRVSCRNGCGQACAHINKERSVDDSQYAVDDDDGVTPKMYARMLLFLVLLRSVLSYLPEVNIFTNYRTEVYNGIPTEIDTTPFMRIGDNYYYIEAVNKLNWFQAAAACRLMNAHLATIEDETEMDALLKYMKAKGFKSHDYFWTSGNDLGTEGAFYWLSTGRPMTYAPWNGPKQMPDNYGGNENCVHMFGAGQLINDANCKIELLYVCEVIEPKTFKFTYIKW